MNRGLSITRLAAIVLFASFSVACFFFVLLRIAGPAPTQDPVQSAPLVKPPRALLGVMQAQHGLSARGERTGHAGDAGAKTKRVRVCIVTMEIGFSSPGGIGTAYTGLALALVEQGHDVTVLFVDDNRHTRDEWEVILSPLKPLGLKVAYLDPLAATGCYYSCQRSYRIYRWLKERDGSFDVVHFHDNGGLAFFPTRAKSQGLALRDTVLCVGAHGPHMWVLEWNRETVDSLVHLEVDEMERSGVALTDVLISPSAYMPRWMMTQGWVLPEHSFVHPNILPTANEVATLAPRLRGDEVLGSRVHVKEFVFFGRLERRKGLWIFLDALDLIWNDNQTAFSNAIITFLGRDTVFRDPTKKNKETRASQDIEMHCTLRGWNCIYMLNMDHVGAIRYLQYPGLVAVMPSPMDNSPNVVSECLMYSIPFIAFSVGGIPELIHPEDRPLVLSEPDAESLSTKLTDALENGAYRARIAMESEVRANVWVEWHKVAQSAPTSSLVFTPTPSPLSVSICVLYNPEKWGNNLEEVVKSVKEQREYGSMPWEIIVLLKSANASAGIDTQSAHPLRMRVVRHKLDESDIVNLYSFAVNQSTSRYVILLDPVSWFYGDTAITQLVDVAWRTHAQIVTAQAILNDTLNSTLLHIGSVGMYSSIVNCIGDWNMLVDRESFVTLPPFDRGDDIWRVYARAMMRRYTLQSIPETLFYQSIRISRDVDHRNTLEVNREFRPLFVRPYDTLVMVTQGFIKTKRLHDIEEEILRNEYDAMSQQLALYESNPNSSSSSKLNFSPLVPSLRHARFFFVRGFEKSGTSWLRDLVGLHPAVFIARWEFHFEIMTRALSSFTSNHWQAAKPPFKQVADEWWIDFVPALMAAGVPEEDHALVKWIGEKSPSAVEPVIPGAKYITIIRDGRDVMISLFFHYANIGGFEGFCPLGYLIKPEYIEIYRSGEKDYFTKHSEHLLELEPCVRFVAKMWNERVRSDLAMMDQLNVVEPRSAHYTLYENMIAKCEEEREKIYRFLDLEPSEAAPLSRVGWTLPGFGNEKENQRNPFYRKGESGDWKNYMFPESKKWFKEEAGEMLIQLGYEQHNDW